MSTFLLFSKIKSGENVLLLAKGTNYNYNAIEIYEASVSAVPYVFLRGTSLLIL